VPPLETMDRYQFAVYWEVLPGRFDKHGQAIVSDDPIQLKVRWNFKRTQNIDAEGQPIALDGTVISDRELKPDSLLWPGKLVDLPPGSDFSEYDDELYVVRTASVTKDLKSRFIRYEFGLVRFRSTLPDTDSTD